MKLPKALSMPPHASDAPCVRIARRALRVAAASSLMLLVLGQPAPAFANSVRQQMVVGGATILDETTTRSGSMSINNSRSSNTYDGRMTGNVFQGGEVGAYASIAGTVNAQTQVTATGFGSFRLTRPSGVNVAGGRVVLQSVLSGEVIGSASLELKVDVHLLSDSDTTTGSDSRRLTDQPGREQVEFGVAVALPATIAPQEDIFVEPTLTLNVIAGITPPGGQMRTSTADALDSGKVIGFRVLNAAGAQVTGFKLSSSGKSIPEIAPPPAGKALAIEYFHVEFAHYFITINADEIAKLDAGIIRGWQRTGQSFNVYTTGGAGLVSVCRFFSASFAPKSSHFYAPRGLGCEEVLANPAWTFEGDVFFTALPDAGGGCPAGNVPVYRLYNNGQGGAPNHRFTTSEAIQLDMIRDGYKAEGKGTGVGMCSPQ